MRWSSDKQSRKVHVPVLAIISLHKYTWHNFSIRCWVSTVLEWYIFSFRRVFNFFRVYQCINLVKLNDLRSLRWWERRSCKCVFQLQSFYTGLKDTWPFGPREMGNVKFNFIEKYESKIERWRSKTETPLSLSKTKLSYNLGLYLHRTKKFYRLILVLEGLLYRFKMILWWSNHQENNLWRQPSEYSEQNW